MKLVVLNFSYGTNPYLRTTEIALGVNEELKRCGQERLGIILPWIYGERQKNILLEEFGRYGHASEIYLDLENFNQYQLVFNHPNFSNKQIRRIMAKAYRSYYLNPMWIMRHLLKFIKH